MQKSNLEKQEAKLKQLNQKIKAEKNKIEQRLGKPVSYTHLRAHETRRHLVWLMIYGLYL